MQNITMPTDNTQVFTVRAEDYAKYRPHYPAALLDLMRTECGLTPEAVMADVGSGTGLLTELFLQAGYPVFGVEPNANMRSAAEAALGRYPRFTSVAAPAEATTLPAHSVDFVTVAQALHWFNLPEARREFARILKPGGWVVAVWNSPRLTGTPFSEALQRVWNTHLFDLGKDKEFDLPAAFFGKNQYARRALPNHGHPRTFEQLLGGFRSSSHAPLPDQPRYAPMVADLQALFETHQQDGVVLMDYETEVVWGQLSS